MEDAAYDAGRWAVIDTQKARFYFTVKWYENVQIDAWHCYETRSHADTDTLNKIYSTCMYYRLFIYITILYDMLLWNYRSHDAVHWIGYYVYVSRKPHYILLKEASSAWYIYSVYMNYTELPKDTKNAVLKLQTKDTDDSYQWIQTLL